MGTPHFAVPSLVALHEHRMDISLVITQPDRKKGRGRKLVAPPVKQAAESFGYDIIQPESSRTPSVQTHINRLNPDVIVVVAFGQILPKEILLSAKKGVVNVHASLLPKYRGPAPIQWAIINGETETGVTTMLMDEKMDTGDMLLSEAVPITSIDTSQTLYDRLADIGADILVRTLNGLKENTIQPVPQDHTQATYAPMLRKQDGLINWNQPANKIETFIRGMNPWPGAFTRIEGKNLKIFRVEVEEKESEETPGRVVKGFPDELWVATGTHVVSILEIQSESGKRLPIREFLRGYPIAPGTLFESAP